jgi:16S rRNA G966 N2-methylase RsmD
MKLRIDRVVRSLIPSAGQKHRLALKDSLRTNGCLQPIKAWGKVLLDGHKRYRLCRLLDIPFKVEQVHLPTRQAALMWVEEHQLTRYDLSDDQRAAIAVRIMRRRKRLARSLRSAVAETKQVVRGHHPRLNGKAKGLAALAVEARVSEYRILSAIQLHRLDRKLFAKVISGAKGLTAARKEIAERERLAERRAMALSVKRLAPQVRNADFRTAFDDLPDNSVDLIFTDPPYDNESIPLYEDLAKLAARVLVPGGSLVCYAGVPALPTLLRTMSQHIPFWWQFCLRLQGAFPRFHSRRVHVHYKPLLWFVKGQFKGDYVIDVIESTWLAKNWHDWEQSEAEAAHCITKLSPEDGLVLDPMCGSGTTLLVARQLNRRFLGAEIDEFQAKVATARLREIHRP